ncbi:MAG: PspA/IM30 family protein [Propionibacteriaceae bacterium]|jgi:phage shock protein A|nr:PspA/IM30 family protein [Propionibacteriaceae bacterium]
MASLWERFTMLFKSKADKVLDRYEDPRETLDYSYKKQQDLLVRVRRGVADVATSRKRVEIQVTQLGKEVDKMTLAAQQSLAAGREDLAREALTRKSGLQVQMNDLETQHGVLQQEEEKLVRASTQLQQRIEAFRTQKETIKATYSAAEAQTRVNEAFTGLSDEFGDVGRAIQRAQDKTQEMQARASAVDELLASGALEDPSLTYKDDITRELEAMASTAGVESELAAMKAALPGGSAPAQLAAGAPKVAATVVDAEVVEPPASTPNPEV